MAFVWIQSPTRPGDDGKRYVTEEKAALLALSGWTTTTPPDGAPSPVPGDTPVTHDELAAALAGLGAGGVADATSSTKGIARIMAGTADDPRYPASRIEGQVQDAQVSNAIARAAAVSALAATVDELPFPEGSVNQTGAAVGRVVAVTGTSPTAYGLRTLAELGAGSGGSGSPTPVTAAFLQKMRQQVDDCVLCVVGDSTGGPAQSGSWGPRLAAWLAAQFPTHTVKRYEWNTTSLTYDAPTTVQTGTGARTLHYYNGGAPGQGVEYSITNYAALVPVTPDLILYNHGHNNSQPVETIPPDQPGYRALYLQLIRKTIKAYPRAAIVLTTQNPKTAPRPDAEITAHRRRALCIAQLAGTEGCGLIDTMGAFLRQPSLASLTQGDGIHPTTAGYDLWLAEAQKQFPTDTAQAVELPRRTTDRLFVPSALFQVASGSITVSYAVEDQYYNRFGALLQYPDNASSAAAAWITIPEHWENFDLTLLWSTPAVTGNVNWRTFLYDYAPGSTAGAGGAKVLGNLRSLESVIPQSPIAIAVAGTRQIIASKLVSGYALPADSLRMVQATVLRVADQPADSASGIAELHAVVLDRAS